MVPAVTPTDPSTRRNSDTMTRREALQQRKDDTIAQLRAAAAGEPNITDRTTGLHLVALVDLFMDVLIDIAHPER